MAILRERVVWQRVLKKTRRRLDAGHLDGEQAANVIRAILFLGVRHGGLNALARVMVANRTTITRAVHGHRRVSPALALRIAKMAGVSLADVLSGAWPKARECPMCRRC